MSQLLTLSRAAQLIGVTRGALQKRIRDGELPAFDGMVETADLLNVYPDLRLEDSGAFERVRTIKEQAFGRRVRERMLPSQEVLAQRLVLQSEELADLRRHLAAYHDLVETLREAIDAGQRSAPAAALHDLGQRLDAGLAAILGREEKPDALSVMDGVLRVMAAHVTVKPSGREFLVEGSESILNASLRAGLSPSYGCGNGNCGLCKARVVSGETRAIQHCDYPFSAAEKAQNYMLMCANTAVSDLVVELMEAAAPDDIPEQQLTASVKSVTALDADTLLLHLQTPRSQRLRFLAGQNVSLGIAGGTIDFSADYPIASCPCDDRNLLFHIARDGGDAFSQRLFSGAVQRGDPVNVRGPWGRLVLDKESSRPLLFACCDTGFAPVASLVEHAMAVDAAESMAVVWAATRVDGHYFANQCRAWAGAFDSFRYLPCHAADEAAAGAAAAAAAAALPDLTEHDVYLSGPPAFIDAARAALAAIGIANDRIRSGP